MPMYTTACQKCQKTAEVHLSYSDYDAVKIGEKLLSCGACEGDVHLVFNPGQINFILRDGESGGWTSKAMKENRLRAARQQVMERRQRDHAPRTRLLPNFAGQQTESWTEARALAFDTAAKEIKAETGDGQMALAGAREAAKTYDPLVKKEGLCLARCTATGVGRTSSTSWSRRPPPPPTSSTVGRRSTPRRTRSS